MRWRELAGPTVTELTGPSFGTFIIEQSLSSLDGEANIRLACQCCLRYVASNPGGEASNTREAMISSRVLVVEDDTLLAFEMQDILSDAGYDVVGPAATIAEALALIDSRNPHAAFVDCNLNGEPATAVALALTAKNIPFVVVTGSDHESLPAAFSNALFAGKPFRAARLLEIARSLLSDSQL
jgi:CheY-like chemotaxis protein